jgi:hypothetical protein
LKQVDVISTDKPQKDKTTNEKPVSLNPLDFEETLRDLLTIPPSQNPKDAERKQPKDETPKKRGS